MPKPMTTAEIFSFLSEAPRTGHVATVRADGRPHVVPVWFGVDGEDILFATSSDTVKSRNLVDQPIAAISVDDEAPPFAFAMVEGTVTIERDMDVVRHWAGEIAARYMGMAWARAYSASDSFPDDMLCRLTPTNMTGMASMAPDD
jgi:PPOX class probable F420-dependent enzyme